MSLFGIYQNRNCPLVALLHAGQWMPAFLLQANQRVVPKFLSTSLLDSRKSLSDRAHP